MEFQPAIQQGFRKYFDFKTRASRSEYWYWCLFAFIAGVIASLLDMLIGISLASAIVSLALFIPGISVSVRRIHDVEKSGWWLLIFLIPIVNFVFLIVYLVWACTKGTPGPNRFGPDPLAAEPLVSEVI